MTSAMEADNVGKYAALGRPDKTKSALMARALQVNIVNIDDF